MTKQARIIWAAAIVLALTNCTFRKPTTQTVAPSGTNDSKIKVEKSFFTGKDASGNQKRFLFGRAPEREIGYFAEMLNTHGVPEFEHTNIEFRISDTELIGYAINPTYPNDISRAQALIKIPIESHFYYERKKDGNGRDTNEMIENTERSHPSARPFMKLDLTRMKVIAGATQFGGYRSVLATEGTATISDIEFIKEQGFLGFSMQTDGGIWGSNQATHRVNLLAYTHNPNFQKTPFHEQNYKFMNVLHVMGMKTETQKQKLFAAHWDLNREHKVILTGFPKQYEHLGFATVEAWNKAFQDIGAIPKNYRPFVAEVKELKHPFDLRYTSLHWVSDIRISMASPLGVGVTTADNLNGEVLWGKVTVYGGYIEEYLKSNMPASGVVASMGRVRFADSLFNMMGFSKNFSIPSQLTNVNVPQLMTRNSDQLLETHATLIRQALQKRDELERLKNVPQGKPGASGNVELNDANMKLSPEHVRTLFAEMGRMVDQMNRTHNNSVQLGQLVSSSGMDRLLSRLSEGKEEDKQLLNLKRMNPQQQFETLAREHTRTDCSDRTLQDVVGGWGVAIKQAKNADMQFLMDSIIYELLLHEMGHMIGLGHQFKENILPEKGSVPDAIYNQLSDLATPEAGYANMTSVMGYRSPRAEIGSYAHAYAGNKRKAQDAIVPGEQDKLVLRYLYKQQVATYTPGEEKFRYYRVPDNGIIPTNFGGRKTSYFPQCNDMEASYGLDPYCNRFDMGHDAKTIVTSYFDFLKDTMIQRMISFGDARNLDAASAEFNLWMTSLRSFSRVRVFYDYMRAKMETDMPFETAQLLQNEEAIYDFSNACTTGSKNDRVKGQLEKLFAKSPQIRELCEVNTIILKEYANILSLSISDNAKVDFTNYFFPSGLTGGEVDYDYSRAIGTWRELGAFPMKLAALFAMETATPFVTFGPYIFPIPNFDTPERRYAMVSLYPREYTMARTATVKSNLRFANVHAGEATRIGKSVLYMGVLPHIVGQHNDSKRLPPQFMQRLRSQSNFDVGYVAVLLKKAENQTDKYIAKKFIPTIYDLNTGKEANATEAYLLPEGEVVVKAENTFLVPVSKFQFLNDEVGFVFAYRLTFYEDDEDVLSSVSPKTALRDLHDQTLDACLKGKNNEQNGLSMYFNPTNEAFKGFSMPPNISVDKDKQRIFKESIRLAYQDYYGQTKGIQPVQATCQDAVQGLRMVISAAAVLNGFWLPYAGDYIQN